MKALLKLLFISVLTVSVDSVYSQTINWAGLNDDHKNIITANFGHEYGFVYGLSYGRHFRTRLFPFVATIEFSSPTGKDVFDDIKVEAGVRVRWIEIRNFQFSTKINGVFVRYENDFARLANFGSDLAGVIGYYRPKWFVSGEVGFDKAIVTNFKHSPLYLDINPTASNGWFKPSTGGNFYFGLQTGISIRRSDVTLRLGEILTQDFKTRPTIPYYVQLGYNWKF